ncbi:MAG TPA: AMP-binding protein [Methylomirabilota bacterium]|jgi:fatty-acyl-CoA synthase|nr:AMP-binding protein [Methylomirabilota bacterium]
MTRGLGPALTLGQMLDEAAARDPAHEAIVFRDERVSYGQLKARADAFALGLVALGLRRGDHVVLWMPNRVEWNVAHLAIAKAGCVTVTCNSRYKALEVEYVLRQSDAKALILADRFDAAGVDYLELLREIDASTPRLAALRHVIVLGSSVPAGCRPWAEVEALGRGSDPRVLERIGVTPDDPAAMLYTSGTTGEPKGCLLSHGNVYYKCRVYTALHEWTARDRYFVPVPYFHIFGCMGGTAANCLVGSTQVVMDVFDPGEAMRLIEAERVTVFSGVPTMFITILNHPDFGRYDLRSLRTGSIGAAPVPAEIMRRILDREGGLGMDALVVYGLTEATGGTHWTRPGDPLEKRVATVGLPTPEIEDRVVDPITGAPVGPGEEGEVCVKGPTMMMGYYKKPEATAEKLRDGWLRTGDMGVKDSDGYLRITGRLTDMIIVGGFNTYPAEIENFFLRHPKVLDVSIVGVPDPIMGEAVMAFVIPRAGESLTAEEVAGFARGKIANFKVPKYVEIVASFPLTGSGKVQKVQAARVRRGEARPQRAGLIAT